MGIVVSTKCKGPVYALADVKKLANLSVIGSRVAKRVEDQLGCSAAEAESYIRQVLSGLVADDYVDSRVLDYNPSVEADVYGVANDDGNWYVKFYSRNGRVFVVSCHPPEHNLRTMGGKVRKGNR